jgi:PadR family transcriptional regulator, regulatory protein AphA
MGEIIRTETGAYVSSTAEDAPIASGQDILDLLALCSEIQKGVLLLEEAHLSPDFFDLSSGLAGEIMLKLTNYWVKTAVVANLPAIPSQRFHELVYECNKGSQINFFSDTYSAAAWLTA